MERYLWSNKVLRKQNLFLLLCAAICGAVLFQLFWLPAPNVVRLKVSGVQKVDFERVLKLYYGYDLLGLRGLKEYQSESEVIHRSHQPLQVDFSLPGFNSLQNVRLDFGIGDGELNIHHISFGYSFASRFYELHRISPAEILAKWEPNNQVLSAVVGEEYLKLVVTGEDPYAFIPIDVRQWQNTFAKDQLWRLRFLRIVVTLFASACLLLIWQAVSANRQKILAAFAESGKSRWPVILYVATVTILGFVVYSPYLLLDKLYLFSDVANDSIAVFWPIYIHLSDYIRSEGLPLWSFSLATGKSLFSYIGDPFRLVHILLPRELIGFGFGWIQFTKVILAAVLFYGWLRLVGLCRLAAMVAATGLSFSAHMVIRGNWVHYATEVVVVAFALVAIEVYLNRRIWHLIPVAIVFLITRGIFHTYVWTVVFIGYVACRLWVIYGGHWQRHLQVWGRLIPVYLLGIGLAGVYFLPSFAELLGSVRVSGNEAPFKNLLGSSIVALDDPKAWLSALYGLFAPDILGRGIYYSGWGNYLEGPHLYTGLFLLLLVPQAMVRRGKRLRMVLAAALLVALAYICLPWVRSFFNAFAGQYFKTSSFWISLLLAGCGGLALDNLIRHRILNLWLLALTTGVGAAVLLTLNYSTFVYGFVRVGENTMVYPVVFVLLACYGLVFVLLRYHKSRNLGLILLPCLIFLEIVYFAGGSSQKRYVLRGDAVASKGYYFNESLQAVQSLKERHAEFFRIEKVRPTVSFNDALAQGYYGVESYNSFNSSAYLRFLGPEGFDVQYGHRGVNRSAYISGLDKRFVLETLLSVKFYIAPIDSIEDVPRAYRTVDRVGDYVIFENPHALPLGIVYHRALPEDVVRRYQPEERDILALVAAVVPRTAIEQSGLVSIEESDLPGIVEQTLGESVVARQRVFDEKSAILAQSGMAMTSFSENSFTGRVNLDQNGLLFLSIPWEKGWRFTVNHHKVDPVLTHFGFYGIPLPPGSHEVSGSFTPPFLKLGLILSVLSAAIWVGMVVRKRRPANCSFPPKNNEKTD